MLGSVNILRFSLGNGFYSPTHMPVVRATWATIAIPIKIKTLFSSLTLLQRPIQLVCDAVLPSAALILGCGADDSNCLCISTTRKNLRLAAWNRAMPSGNHVPIVSSIER